MSSITPVLTVRGAAEAVAFYQHAFGAEEVHRTTYPDGRIVAELAVGGARFRVADEAPEAANLSPATLGGTTVRINLLVADQPYGLRQGRLADPFGHHWLIGRPLDDASGDWARGPGV
ncbi:MAG TPA: VOC family protein [Actinomycetes bacterium]|nr:VOC family protein [Actinomycetes bacterium]